MRTLGSLLFAALLTAPAALHATSATAPQAAPEREMTIENRHVFTARLIRDYMQRRHYFKRALDDELSAMVLERYIDILDPGRHYFLKRDVDTFAAIRHEFDEYLKEGELRPPFEIFKVYRARVRKQTEAALEILERDFDFGRDEFYVIDRRGVPWAADQAALDETWRKRIKNDLLSLMIAEQDIDKARETLRKRYRQIHARTERIDSGDVFRFYMNAYLTSVEPHTTYLSPRESANFKIRMSLSLEGIGAVLQDQSDYTLVTRIVPGGPADLSGQLHAGDRIVGVGQGEGEEIDDVIGWRLDDVVDRIRGPKGTVVRLRVLPEKAGGETRDISLVRDRIKLEEQAAKKSLHEFTHEGRDLKIGVIDVPTFYSDLEGRAQGDPQYRSTTKDVRILIEELEGEDIDALIVDLRGNPGGALTEAISLTGLFIESGPVVQVRDLHDRIQVNVDPDPLVGYRGPLAVMVNRNSASASEIFAGAIQDYRRGIVVGEPTFGKGTVQHVVNLDRHRRGAEKLGQLKLTVAQFFRVNGDSTQHRGVVPDIPFPTAANADDEGERAHDNALPWSRVPAVVSFGTAFEYGGTTVLDRLIRRHEERRADSPALRYVREAEGFAVRMREVRRVSLDEAARRDERDERRREGIEIENRLRVASGIEPLRPDSDSDDPTTAPDGGDDDFPPDVLLNETGRILADLIALRAGDAQVVQTHPSAPHKTIEN